MRDTLNTLSTYPEIGITTSMGSGVIHYLGVLNPILSFVSLLIGIIIGLVTLYLKIREWGNE
tara:strand:+ start:658 stop:843 length:186 start_codon:yes stop_codon:yes gene_type:complete